jgi:hypothetical protein
MMRIRWRRITLVIALLLVPAFVAAGDEHPDFSGTWLLNEELSDDAREKIREAIVARRRGGMGEPGRGRPGGPGGGEGGWSRMGEMRDRMRKMEEGIQRLTIAQSASELTIRNAIDREYAIVADGRKRSREGAFGSVESQATWKKRSLVIVDRPEQGAMVTRTYFYRRNDPHLYVMVKVEGRGPIFEYQRVYDRAATEDPEKP